MVLIRSLPTSRACLVWGLASFLGLAPLPAASAPEEIGALLEPIRKTHGLPALAGAVFTREGLLAAGVTGVRKAGSGTPATPEDLWHLGSETKAMTATLAGSFVAEGALAWDDPMEALFPEFARDIDPALRGITVAQLLSHRSGLVANVSWQDHSSPDLPRARRALAKQLLTAPPAFPPGDYHYSNAGYVVVGAILEQRGKKPWEDLLTERLFRPLGMDRAGFGGTGTPGRLDQPWGHFASGKPAAGNGPLIDNPAVLGPAGTVHASLADWAKFLSDQLRGGSGSNALLPAPIYRRIQAPSPAGTGYGLGWGIAQREWAGGKALTHSGSNTMNYAVCWLGLPKGMGVLAAANQAGPAAEQAADEAAAALLAWYRRQAPTPRPSEASPPTETKNR